MRSLSEHSNPEEKPLPPAEPIPKLDFPASEFVQSLQRGLQVIRSFDEEHNRMTLAEVAGATGMTRASARRFLLTLSALGYVGTDKKQFWLLPKTMSLGYTYLSSIPWWRHAQRVAQRLAQKRKLACGVAVLDGEEIVYVAYSPPVYVRNVPRSIGSRQVAFATAIGRVLLANLPPAELDRYLGRMRAPQLTPMTEIDPRALGVILRDIRARRYALVSQQTEIGLHAIGVPVFDRSGQPLAAMSLSSRDPWMQDSESMKETLDDLWSGAAEITEGLPA